MIRLILSITILIVFTCSCSISKKTAYNAPKNNNTQGQVASVKFEMDSDIPHPMTNLADKLGLKGADKEKLNSILSENRKKFKSIMSSGHAGIEARDKIIELEKSKHDEIKAMLSKDQVIIYEKLLLENTKLPYLSLGKKMGFEGNLLEQYATIMAEYGEMVKQESIEGGSNSYEAIQSIIKQREKAFKKALTKAEYRQYKNSKPETVK